MCTSMIERIGSNSILPKSRTGRPVGFRMVAAASSSSSESGGPDDRRRRLREDDDDDGSTSRAATMDGAGPAAASRPATAVKKPTLRPRLTIRNHVSGPGSGDEPPYATQIGTSGSSKEGVLGFASGLVAGVVGVVTGYPFDVIKTRRQVFGASARLLDEGGLSQPPSKILQQVFRGIGPPLVTTGVVQTLNFGCFDWVLRSLRASRAAELQAAGASPEAVAWALAPENARLRDYFLAGFCGGVSISFITCPASLVKIQMQTTRSASYWSILAGMRSRGIVNGFYRAYIPDVMNQSFGRGVYMVSYEYLKRELRAWDGGGGPSEQEEAAATPSPYARRPQPLHQRIIAAAIAGIAGWLAIYPLDVVKSKLQADALAPGKNRYSGTIDCFRQTVAAGGVRALFNGMGFTLVRAVPVASVILPTYDYCYFYLSVALGVSPAAPLA